MYVKKFLFMHFPKDCHEQSKGSIPPPPGILREEFLQRHLKQMTNLLKHINLIKYKIIKKLTIKSER